MRANIKFNDVVLNLDYKCNFNCKSCLLGEKKKSNIEIGDDLAKATIDSVANSLNPKSIGFVGGEPFLKFNRLTKLCEYINKNYHLPISVSTNAYWACDIKTTEVSLSKLHKNGLRRLLVSCDDFHLEFIPIEYIANVISICQKLKIDLTLQNILIKGCRNNTVYASILGRYCDTSQVRWIENPCTPVGTAFSINENLHAKTKVENLKYGECNAGKIFNIQPNGEVKPCCGAGLLSKGLTIGNVFIQQIKDILTNSSLDPLINSLVAYCGPKHLFENIDPALLTRLPSEITDPCELCFRIFDDNEIVSYLREKLSKKSKNMIVNRLATEFFGSRGFSMKKYAQPSAALDGNSATLHPRQ